jgi:deazaflavin-dependent oxidoreductase (nitroreductase family)
MATPKDLAARALNVFHRNVYHLTGGRIGGRGYGMPVVVLTTTGRKTGAQRSTMLTTPVHDTDRVVLVASYGGDDRHPAWFLNLRENPEVTLEIEGETREMTARVASDAEKAELWPEIVASHKGYAGYQEKTDRDIPVVILER